MQRLGPSVNRRVERGATAVLVGLLMVVLLGVAAIAVDMGALWWDRKQLQNGADAGALAIAGQCAAGACGATADTASYYAGTNKLGGDATGTVESLTGNSVTVRTDTMRTHWFAQFLKITQSPVQARATATWGRAKIGAVLPLAFSICEFKAQAGSLFDVSGLPKDEASTPIIGIKFSKDTKKTDECTGPSGNFVPAGFGWLQVGVGCSATVPIDGVVYSDNGRSPPQPWCGPETFQKMQNQVILVPIFDDYVKDKDDRWYVIYGYAAFRLMGYRFPGVEWNCSGCANGEIRGKFLRYVSPEEVDTSGGSGPDLGIMAVELTD